MYRMVAELGAGFVSERAFANCEKRNRHTRKLHKTPKSGARKDFRAEGVYRKAVELGVVFVTLGFEPV